MAAVTSRTEFKDKILRKLGSPVLQINVTDAQVDDAVDDALKYYWDYHYDGSEVVYLSTQITQEIVDQKYITVPENIIGAIRFFATSSLSSTNMFSLSVQFAQSDFFHTLASGSLVPFYMAMTRLAEIEQLLVGQAPIRFNRHQDRVYFDMTKSKLTVGNYLVLEAYRAIDPDVWTDMWDDRWLIRYATAMVKKQWGSNMKKFNGVTLPGGVQLNGQQIYDEAEAEVKELESEMINSYSLPVYDMIG
jgi:hypothetical protein